MNNTNRPFHAEQHRKLFIGGLSFETTDDGLKKHFSQWGEVVDCVVMKDPHSKRSRGFGFVTYKENDCVDEAQKHRPHVIDNKEVEAKRAVPREVWNNCPEAHATVKKLFLGGVKEDMSKEDIEKYFSQFGEVENVEMKLDKETGKKRGFCFVLFSDYDPVDKCVLIKTHHINSHRCEAKKALSRADIENIQMRSYGGPGPNYGGMGFHGPRGGGMFRGGFRGGRGGGMMNGGFGGNHYDDMYAGGFGGGGYGGGAPFYGGYGMRGGMGGPRGGFNNYGYGGGRRF